MFSNFKIEHIETKFNQLALSRIFSKKEKEENRFLDKIWILRDLFSSYTSQMASV